MGKAIIGITPELLFEFLGLQKFRVLRTQYNFEKNTVEFVVENDILPEVEPGGRLTEAKPFYTSKYDDHQCVGVKMTGISIWDRQRSKFMQFNEADIPPVTPEQKPEEGEAE